MDLDNPPTQIFDLRESEFPDSVLVSHGSIPRAEGRARPKFEDQPSSSLFVDLLVYLSIVGASIAIWRINELHLFEAGDDIGYWLGVAGGVMMLVLFSYPIRKHLGFARNWGRVKLWLWLHMLLGVGGPLLIVLHSTFRVGSMNAAVALYSMLAVAISGVVGRYMYARVNRGLYGEKVDLRTLMMKAGFHQEDARSRLAFSPKVEQRLLRFHERQLLAEQNWLTYFRLVFWLPFQQAWVYLQSASDLRRAMRTLAVHHQWSSMELMRRKGHAKKLVWIYLTAVARVAQFTAYEKLFSLWHVVHIPFVYLMVLSAVVHVIAVHVY